MSVPSRTLRGASLLLLCCIALTSGGCSVAGALANVFNPPRVNPVYVPSKTAPMLVLVENRQNPGMLIPEAEEFSVYITRDLEREEVAPLVAPAKLQELRDRDPQAYRGMSITAIGKAVGAQQILYVDLVSLEANEVAGLPTTGAAELHVHVIDVASGKTIWPSTGFYTVKYETNTQHDMEAGETRGLRQKLLAGAAHHLGRLFYQWDPEAEEQ